MSKELIFASEEEAVQHLANITNKQIKIARDNKSGLQDFMTHHYNEILRLKKGQGLSDYDTENKERLISFLDEEMGRFKNMIASNQNKIAEMPSGDWDIFVSAVSDEIDKQAKNIVSEQELYAKIDGENYFIKGSKNKFARIMNIPGDFVSVSLDVDKLPEDVRVLNNLKPQIKVKPNAAGIKEAANFIVAASKVLTDKKSKTASDKKHVALTVFGQLLVDKLQEEIESDKPGKLTKSNVSPMGLMAVDQPLIDNLWKKSREKHNL